jgi:hypothetical protein
LVWHALALAYARGIPRPKKAGAESLFAVEFDPITGQIGEVGRLIEAVRAGDERGEIHIDRPQRAVITHFIEVLNEEELSEEDISLFRVSSFAPRRKFDLRHPVVYRDYFGLGEPTFDPRERLAAAAKRILACFPHYCGRRAACVVLMTIGDLAMGCNPKVLEHFAAYCRYTKNRSQRNGWHPIAYLWPETELTFARAFLIACREAGLPDSLQLMQVAGCGQRTEKGKNVAYSKHTVDLAQLRLRDALVPGRRLSTHLGRFAFASYWQLRVLAMTYPFLRSMPLFVQLKSHYWFQDEGLEKLGQLLQHIPCQNAAQQRLRPILMTSIAFISGVLPLALSTGAGSGGENAIGTGVVGGMLAATFLAIFFVPIFFVIMLRLFRVKLRSIEPTPPELSGYNPDNQSRINAELQEQLNKLYELVGLQCPRKSSGSNEDPSFDRAQEPPNADTTLHKNGK